ncbi:Peptidase family M23 [Paracoccus halophilus]|uniref:Peptidase family M23 n=1 Tax=Paracoccus halophilus TaxID=376733 RepID=A0A1I0TJI5_9RHOB|nr:M23 family metallopeptidase [Paracoccus halophilus]SFA51961.1 Peptidase family M23 [Paracoccus halophilus]
MTEIDPRFRQMGRVARRRRRRGRAVRAGAGLVLLALLAGLGWRQFGPQLRVWFRDGGPEMMAQVEAQFDIAPVRGSDTFADIPGDPLIIPANEDGPTQGETLVPAPAALAASRRVATPAVQLAVLDSRLIPRDRRLVAALPSTREEFALFQAERSRERLMNAGAAAEVLPGPGDAQLAASGVAFLRDAAYRAPLWRELILETARPIAPEALLAENGFDAGQAQQLGARLRTQLDLDESLPAGAVLALRYRPGGARREVIQLSLYDTRGFVGSLALSAAGQLVPAADAWADQPLLADLMQRGATAPQGQQRLLDVIYSAALRNDVPPEIIGEALALMSQVHDLDGYADDDDRLTLIYSAEAAIRPGAVLFVGVTGPSGDRRCYVVPAPEGFECYAPGARVQLRAAGLAGLLPPVGGVLSQRFVPAAEAGGDAGRGRVFWTAPQGSPVLAAAAGRVTALDPGRVEITHEDGLVSRYAGLGAPSPRLSEGAQLARGAVLGQIGPPSGGQQPGLSFALLKDGRPVDPLPYFGAGTEVLASDSIESLIGHIIRVESAGNARARNPRSTATGLGQFIESTWLRMMRSYRPDLVAGMTRRELLDLRLDPEMSRRMVRRLAQENEAYLRARGHSISAGRLYLAHFLGPAGADLALRADPGQQVHEVMGAAVVSANPFLRGWSIGQLQNWAERRMSGAAAPAMTVVPELPASAELRAFMAEMDRLRPDRKG